MTFNLCFTLIQLKDFKRAEQAIDAFIAIQSMTTLPSSELKKKMDGTDILSYPLLQWCDIFGFCRKNPSLKIIGRKFITLLLFRKVGLQKSTVFFSGIL